MKTDNTLDILNLQFIGKGTENQLLIFYVGKEAFGINVCLVQELIRYIPPTQIPRAPLGVKGVINFRGEVIPVLDLRERFKLSSREYNQFSVIIVVEYFNKIMGLIVEEVSDIVYLPQEDIQAIPEISNEEKTAYLKGMGKQNERLILLLDMEKIMDLKEKKRLENALKAHDSGGDNPNAATNQPK